MEHNLESLYYLEFYPLLHNTSPYWWRILPAWIIQLREGRFHSIPCRMGRQKGYPGAFREGRVFPHRQSTWLGMDPFLVRA